jgi:hypothetical protein
MPFSHLSCVLIPASRLNMRANTTRGSLVSTMEFIASLLSHMLTSRKRTGEFLCQIFLQLGLICVWKASSSLGMSPIPSFVLLHPLLRLLLIPWLPLSVPSTSIGSARLHSSKCSPTVIPTESFGWKASISEKIQMSSVCLSVRPSVCKEFLLK